MRVSDQRAAEALARCEAATPGPWGVDDGCNVRTSDGGTPTGVGGNIPGLRERNESNVRFIAPARTAPPDALPDRRDANAMLRAFIDANGDEAAHKNVAARARAFLGDT